MTPPHPLLATKQGAGTPHRPRLIRQPGDKSFYQRNPELAAPRIYTIKGVEIAVSIRILVKKFLQLSSPSNSPTQAPTSSITAVSPWVR